VSGLEPSGTEGDLRAAAGWAMAGIGLSLQLESIVHILGFADYGIDDISNMIARRSNCRS